MGTADQALIRARQQIAALTADAAPKGGPLQVAAQTVVPLVIRTQQILGMALADLTQLYTAMGTAVLDNANAAIEKIGVRFQFRIGGQLAGGATRRSEFGI